VLREILSESGDQSRQLRAIWALHVTGGLDQAATLGLLDHRNEHIRAWAIRLLADAGRPGPAALARFANLAAHDPSRKVRLSLASVLQRLPLEERWSIALPLAGHPDDALDRVLPLMLWYSVEPLVASDHARAVAWAARCQIPIVRRHVARRAVSSNPAAGLTAVASSLEKATDASCTDLLLGSHEALRGRKNVPPPDGWPAVFGRLIARPQHDLVEAAYLLALDLKDPTAVTTLRRMVLDRTNSEDLRKRMLSALVERRAPDLGPYLHALLEDKALRGTALRSLAAYDDPATPRVILGRYADYFATERSDAIATLAARPAWALELLGAIERGQIARRDVSVSIARQLLAFGDPPINERLEAAWGKVQPTSKTKAALAARYKALLSDSSNQPAQPSRGRAVFNRICLSCHRLYDSGGDVGPELTGSDRANPDYILENVLDPTAAVSREYTLTNFVTTDGRLISGIIREQTDASLSVQTANERIVLPRDDLEAIKPSSVSMMPEGLLEPLSAQEVRDLFAYLASTGQVPLPGGGP
jgi:putative heme-binding domain-containing protein